MALSNLNTLSEAAYFSLLYDMIKQRENPWLYAGTGFERIHNGGGDGNPTFGYGFNLAAFNANIVEQVISHAYSGVLTARQGDGLDLILDWKTGAPVWVGGQSVTLTNANIINMADVSLNGAPGAFGSSAQRAAIQSLSLNDAQATRMLNVMIKGDLNLVHIEGPAGSYGYEDGLDYRLEEEGVLGYSAERAALLSVYYNAPSLIGPGVQNAVATDDRPQLWYEIRYNHNHYNHNGLQNRRAEEADLLGLVSQAAQNNPDTNILEFAHALDTLFNEDDRLGRRLLTRIEERDGLDDFQAAVAPELQALLDYYVLEPLGANGAPTIEYVQADSNNISQTMNAGSAAGAGVPGGDGAATTVNLILGEGGDDLIIGLGAADYLYGGDGNDTVYGDGGGTSVADAGHDLIDGGDGADLLIGGYGDEYIAGGAGDDTLIGGAGADQLFSGFGDDRADGGAGADLIRTGPGKDTLLGGAGADTLGASNRSDLLRGGDGGDLMLGSNGNDRLFGDAGNDTLLGGNGRDTLEGGAGADRLVGGGGAPADTASYANAGGGVHVRLSIGVGVSGEAGGDQLLEIENLTGSAFDDTLEGDGGANRLDGNAGNDRLLGFGGADQMIGDRGDDTLGGGVGNDTFLFFNGDGADVITDFTAGAGTGDTLRLFNFGAAFDSFAEVIAAASDDGTDTTIDFGGGDQILLQGVTVSDLHTNDFIF